ncbi:hypothetical protein M4D49_26965 [Cupriavidus pauculus]|uniref:hypothetical protein n=1 Tax=Burkholderiaceae TaxID=119060 RepID=UPI000B12F6D3|nr:MULTISPECIES: hypothetical protein [Burkholderiaceae]MCM3609129.1 hypothetical protein [Cupriavidus pauculus]
MTQPPNPVYLYSMPRFPIGPDGKYIVPRLTAAQLRAAYERNPCAEVRELLWEIHRLRLLVLRANQLLETMGRTNPPATQLVKDILLRELEGEPCIDERNAWAREFFGPPRVSEYTRRRQAKA